MKFNNTASEPRKIEDLPPKGMQVARCYSVVDLGTQEVEWEGIKKLQRKMMVTFELPNHTKVFDEDKGKQPIVIGQKYTQSFHEKSRLMEHLTSWFSDGEIEGDLLNVVQKKLVGRSAYLNIKHDSYEKGGKTYPYAQIAGINPLPKEVECSKQVNGTVFFDLDNFDEKVFDSLPEWMQKVIKESPEYKEAVYDELGEEEPQEKSKTPIPDSDIKESDLPFN